MDGLAKVLSQLVSEKQSSDITGVCPKQRKPTSKSRGRYLLYLSVAGWFPHFPGFCDKLVPLKQIDLTLWEGLPAKYYTHEALLPKTYLFGGFPQWENTTKEKCPLGANSSRASVYQPLSSIHKTQSIPGPHLGCTENMIFRRFYIVCLP